MARGEARSGRSGREVRARLIVIRGARHRFHEIEGARVGVGALPENEVVLEGDPAVSRRHCELVHHDGRWVVRDRGSRTGTFLNEVRIEQGDARLEWGDRIRVGQSVVLFAPPAGADDRTGRQLANLLVLQELYKALNSETDHDQLLELIMDTAIQLTGAERGFLILLKDDQLVFRVARNIDYGLVKSPEFQISNSVIRRVVKSGEPLLTSNAQQDLRDLKSIAALELRSLLCVPLKVKSRTLGTLYLDSHAAGARFDEEALRLLTAFSDQAAIALENARLLQEAREKESILSELRVASRIQLALMPREDPDLPGYEVAGAMHPAREVGGDYYDYIWAPPGPGGRRAVYLAIGDVSGKGVGAGLVMVMARAVLRSLAGRGAAPRDVLREGNRLLRQDLKPGMFMSLLLAWLDPAGDRLLLAGCGHERPLVWRARERRVERIEVGGLVLGVVPDLGPHIEEVPLRLEPGDQLLLYTDGVTEAMDPLRQMFGAPRLGRFMADQGHLPARGLVQALVEELQVHGAGAEQHDDITLIAVKRVAR